MTLAEQIRAAVTQDDARKAGRIADNLRGRGLRYTQILEIFTRHSGIDAADFDALMYEADKLTGRS